ncbi:hypothetical protein GCM10007205_29600 [Oxalicibacterium flavum]|uniref:DUF2818 domain-containing protein n=1 Tax=Oxalicibacterium flavum TaxID=179467 RepID=A0A8J2Y028_9BURK|nr:DUF2818 family protein [Oxalicibacterium flavum]GGC18623.1 hypothetical protein GCM10007205_29600 [Oxalicibacterium flavum]
MDVSLASWFVILLALFCANLPFFNERLFAVIPVRRAVKPVWWRLLELLALYLFVGVVARLMESRIGSVFAQGWEFYAVTGCLFLVFAYPGFVLRYLRRKRR